MGIRVLDQSWFVDSEHNLITNLGFGPNATHTTDPSSKLANLNVHDIGTLSHPPRVLPNYIADQYTWDNVLAPTPEIPNQGAKNKKWYRRFIPQKAA